MWNSVGKCINLILESKWFQHWQEFTCTSELPKFCYFHAQISKSTVKSAAHCGCKCYVCWLDIHSPRFEIHLRQRFLNEHLITTHAHHHPNLGILPQQITPLDKNDKKSEEKAHSNKLYRWQLTRRSHKVVGMSGRVQESPVYRGTIRLLLVQATGSSTIHKPKTSGTSSSEPVNRVLYQFVRLWSYSRQKCMWFEDVE
jgi:hypothetical protein